MPNNVDIDCVPGRPPTSRPRRGDLRRLSTQQIRVALRGTVAALVFDLLFTAVAAAQSARTASAPEDPLSFRSTLTAEILSDLPLGETVYSVLETTQAELIADRFNSSGLNAGEAARTGGFPGSWSQTLFRIGDVDITDPAGSGAPLLFPELFLWQQIDVVTGQMPIDFGASGLAVTLQPRRPTPRWTSEVHASGSGGDLAAPTPTGLAPPIARLERWAHGSALASGPIKANRLGIVAGGTWAQASKFTRDSSPAADSDLASGFAHLVYTPSPATESQTLGWVQRARVPFEYRQLFEPSATTRDVSAHLQSTWKRGVPEGLNWEIAGGVTMRSRSTEVPARSPVLADRLFDGPIPSIASAIGEATAGRWTFGARVSPGRRRTTGRHTTMIGANLDHALARISNQFTGSIAESVDAVPARMWAFTDPETESHRHATTVGAFASDRIAWSPALTLEAAIRFESITGRADGATTGVNWRTWLPRVLVRWEFAQSPRVEFIAGYRRSANRLNLDVLSFGDPAAPTAIVTRWLGAALTPPSPPGSLAVIIDRVGPGTGGDSLFSRIDGGLKRPQTDEYVVGIESRRRGWLRLGLMGIARREMNLLGVVDVGVPLTSYSTVGIPDAGHDLPDPSDDQVLTVYNRLPLSFGRNQYVLTNTDQEAGTAYAVKLTAGGSTDRLFLLFGATAAAAQGSAGNRGFGPLENDVDALGELFTDPNAATFARGRLFADRAFTIKWTTVYRFPGDFHVGAIARYQDGQPFARLVIAPELNQGAELVRADPNAGNRFTFTGTLDLRLQKEFTIGTARMDAVVDVYNLFTRSNEVEEYPMTGPNFRTPTAIEPPHSVHLGMRVTF